MARLSPTGQLALGFGDGVVSIEGRIVFIPGGAVCWKDAETLLFQGNRDGVSIWQHTSAGSVRIDPLGANFLCAGGGVWAAHAANVVRVSTGRRFPVGWRLCDVSDHGHVLVCPYSADSILVTLGEHDVATIASGPLTSDATAGINVRMRGPYVAWQNEGVWAYRVAKWNGTQFEEVSVAPRAEPVNYAVPFEYDQELWLLERSHRLTVRPVGTTLGKVVTTGMAFSPDAVAVDARVHVGWSLQQGEPPEAWKREALQDLSELIDLDAGQPAYQPPVLPSWPVERPCWLGYYWRLTSNAPPPPETPDWPRPASWGPDNLTAPANCDFLVETDQILSRADRPFFAWLPAFQNALTLATPQRAFQLGMLMQGAFCEVAAGETVALEAQVAQAHALGYRVLAYEDRADAPVPSGLTSGDRLHVQLYCGPGESLTQFELRAKQRVAEVAAKLPAGVGMGLCWQAYDRNGLERDRAKLRALQELAFVVALSSPRVDLIAWFSDGRQGVVGGMQTGGARVYEAEMRDVHHAMLGMIKRVPASPPALPSALPKATEVKGPKMKIVLKANGKPPRYFGVDPHPVEDEVGDRQWPVYQDRPAAGSWEEMELIKDGGDFFLEAIVAKRSLTLTPDGAWETRAKGTRGAWEKFKATEQPDGTLTVYRKDGGHLIDMLQFEKR